MSARRLGVPTGGKKFNLRNVPSKRDFPRSSSRSDRSRRIRVDLNIYLSNLLILYLCIFSLSQVYIRALCSSHNLYRNRFIFAIYTTPRFVTVLYTPCDLEISHDARVSPMSPSSCALFFVLFICFRGIHTADAAVLTHKRLYDFDFIGDVLLFYFVIFYAPAAQSQI